MIVTIPTLKSTKMAPEYQYGFNMPAPAHWPDGWEWQEDFDGIAKMIKRDMRRLAARIWMRLGKWIGVSVEGVQCRHEWSMEVAEIDTDKLEDAILAFKDVRETIIREPIALVVGRDIYREIGKLDSFKVIDMETEARFRSPLGEVINVFSIPVILSPYSKGITIIPDLKNRCRWDAITVKNNRVDDYTERARMMAVGRAESVALSMYPQWQDDESRNTRSRHVEFLVGNEFYGLEMALGLRGPSSAPPKGSMIQLDRNGIGYVTGKRNVR